MRLLDTESLETAIVHSGISLNLDVHDFYREVWQLIKAAEAVVDDADMAVLERRLRRTLKAYFAHTAEWADDQDLDPDAPLALPEWHHQVMAARDYVPRYERQLLRYTLCYMHLGRALAQSRAQLQKVARDYPHDPHPVKIKITEMTGLLVSRAFKQKDEMMQKRTRLMLLRSVLEELQERFALLREDLYGVLPGVDVERAFVNFRVCLRQGHFGSARAMIDEWTTPAAFTTNAHKKIVRQNALIITGLVEDNQAGLRVQDGFMLEQSDINLLFSFLDGDEGRVDTFLRKYMLRFMAFKLRHLLNMAHRLGRIGSLEGLLVLHARLVGGMNRPMTDMAPIKHYEQDVVGRVQFLLRNGFPDLGHIFNESEVVFGALRQLVTKAHHIGPAIRPAPSEE